MNIIRLVATVVATATLASPLAKQFHTIVGYVCLIDLYSGYISA